MKGHARSSVHGKPDGNVMRNGSQNSTGMKVFVIPKGIREVIRPLHGIKHSTKGVEQPTHAKQHQGRNPGMVQKLREDENRHPPQGDVDRHPNPPRSMRPKHLESNPKNSPTPNDRQDHIPGRLRHGQQGERRISPRDEKKNHRVVSTLHPLVSPRAPKPPVVQGTDPEQPKDRQPVNRRRQRRERRHSGRRQRDQRRRRGQGTEERPEVDVASQPRAEVHYGLGWFRRHAHPSRLRDRRFAGSGRVTRLTPGA
ncbi:hypothetical protein SAMN05421837_103658 [Amycolatopsis pretoriensis]|uniref:Uncharacterized protein n=1 Tax=Amycolatopsis pretoriensis TaxID=218821 RepID=A0A1H5QLW6_9PSEU|nr:hypothetical protein SAMN05421837_103658 [Amycolatopsis pretoriensis]